MLTNAEIDAVMEVEFAGYLNRCESKGVGRLDAELALGSKLFMASLERSCNAERALTAKADQLREAAFEAFVTGNNPAYKAACEAWLLESKKIAIGDVALVFGWTEPREILVEKFELRFSNNSPRFPSLVFTGPTVRKAPKRVILDWNLCDFEDPVSKTTASLELQQYCKLVLPTIPR